MENVHKVIIVEGKTDREKVQRVLREPVLIICTHGTIGLEKLDELVERIESFDVYLLMDRDEAGKKLQKLLQHELPNSTIIQIPAIYKEVALTPEKELREILQKKHFLTNK